MVLLVVGENLLRYQTVMVAWCITPLCGLGVEVPPMVAYTQ